MMMIEAHPNWPVYADHGLHLDAQYAADMTSVDTITQWREDWSSASVLNHTIVTDPTNRQPGFHLPRHTWSLVNRFRTGQGPCRANLHRWGQRQTMNHIVDPCQLTSFEGGLNLLLQADDDVRSHMAGMYIDCSTCEIMICIITLPICSAQVRPIPTHHT